MAHDGRDDRWEALQADANEHGFHEAFGFTLENIGDDWATATVPHSQEYVNPDTESAMHGGITAAALDAVMGYAVMAAVYDRADQQIGPTINLNVNYVATASEPMRARGDVVRLGKQNAIVEGRVEGTETGKTVATGQGVWRVFGE